MGASRFTNVVPSRESRRLPSRRDCESQCLNSATRETRARVDHDEWYNSAIPQIVSNNRGVRANAIDSAVPLGIPPRPAGPDDSVDSSHGRPPLVDLKNHVIGVRKAR